MADSFTHLHVHTEYSMLDGAARLDELVAAAAADGQPALGITDHGNMYGILDFYRACKDQGVKPILGTEAYMAHDHRTERIAARGKMDDSGGEGEGGKKPWYHLTLLAENETGYKNLIQLASRSFMEGYYRKPKVDWELLEEHSEGLIATTGCLGGHVLQAMVPKAIMDPDKQQADPLSEDERFDNAVKLAGRLQDIFGRDNLFVELQDHGIPAQQWSNPRLAQLAKAIRAPLLATNDSHYVHREDALSHDALLCVQTNSLVSDKNRFKFHGDDHYLKSAEEMRYLFRELPTACDNTLWVAERCEVEIEFGKPQLPNFPLPPGFATDDDYLRHLVFEGAKKRWGDTLDDKVTDRLLFELKVIGDMGFSSYFLITWDLIKHARDNQIRVGPGRGCLHGDALIWTTAGYKPIREVRVGDRVRTHTGATREVSNTFRYEVDEPLVTIRGYSGGGGVSMTGDHKVLIRRGERETDPRRLRGGAVLAPSVSSPFEWVEAREVRVGDLLCIPRPPSRGTAPASIDVARLLPAPVGDCEFEVTDDEIIERVPVNSAFPHSIREVSRASGVSRNAIKTILTRRVPFRGPITGTTRRSSSSERMRDRLLTELRSRGFDSLLEYRVHLARNEGRTRYSHSATSVAKAAGLDMPTLRNVLSSYPESGPIEHLKSAGSVCTDARDALASELRSRGFRSFQAWEEHVRAFATTEIRTPRHIPVDEDLVFVLGAYVADGWIRKGDNRAVGFAERRSELDDELPLLVKRIWGLDTTRCDHATKDLTQTFVRSAAVRSLFHHLVPGYRFTAQSKHLPEWFGDLSIEQKRALLAGLWWGDGSTNAERSSYTTSSPRLMEQVRDLLWAVGAPAGVVLDDRTDDRPEYRNRSVAWKIRTTPGLTPPKLQFGWADDDYVYSRVRSVESTEHANEVFDLEVPVDHSFLTDSYIVHNSAAGCAVAYTLWITDLDPIKYDLLFERFLNPSRISMPDIDMDFDTRYRDEMIRYAAERYGRENVAQIITFGTIKARQAVRDAARVLGHDYGTGDRIAKAMPPLIMGRDTPLYACLEEHPKYVDGYKMATEIREMYSGDPISKEVIDVAKGLEGLRRSDGIHAAAVVITKEPLTTYLPIQRKPEPGKPIEEAPVVTQYEMHGVEDLGLLKMDFLGLRNLDIISDTLDLIQMTRGEMPDIDDVDLEDAKTFELLQAGQTVGVFQLESPPMRALMRSLAPDSFEDVAALVALYRPGPMAANMHNDYADRKNGRKPIEYLHPDAEEILGTTYGLCLTGDTVVVNATTGMPTRLDRIDPSAGFSVQGVDDQLGPVVRPVTHWVCNGERETVRLTLADGHQISGTPDHPVLTERGWVGLGDLRTDDHVAVPKAMLAPERTAPVGSDRMRVLGNLLGDGSVRAGAVALHNDDHDILEQFVSAVRRSFPRTEIVHEDSDGRSRLRCTRKSGRRSDLSEWLRSLGIPTGGVAFGSADKFVPPCLFAAPDEELAVLLAALWDCDGHVNEQLAVYTTVSSRLADDVVGLLRRLGMDASHYRSPYIRPRDGEEMTAHQVAVFDGARFGAAVGRHLASRQKREVAFTNVPQGRTLDRAAVAEMLSAGGASLAATCREAGVSRLHFQPSRIAAVPRVRESVVASVSEVVRHAGLEQIQRVHWVRVDSVEPSGVQPVYDITVDEVHNFIANGMIVHNCIYQESVMRLAQKFAGYSLADADLLRKAAGKKSREIMQKERAKFVDGCERTGYGRELGDAWFDIIEPFADYAFNRSHSVGYGFIAYQIAYLKANYPAEYMSALLTSVKSNLDKAAVYLAECRAMEIPVTVADVNRSLVDFAPELRRSDDGGIDGAEIVFGMSAVRGVGTGHCELIIAEREANGAYADFYDFCERVDLGVLNKKTVEALIKAGAFDSVGHPRQGLLMVFESIIDRTIARRKEAEAGVMSLFDSVGGGEDSTSGGGGFGFDEREEIPDIEFPKAQKLAFEKEMLGLYVSDHPLFGAEDFLARRTEVGLDALAECEDGAIKTVGGVITNLQRKWTKKGDLMGVFVLEDLRANVETMVFPRTMTEHGHKLEDDAIVIVKARIDKRDDMPKLIAMEIEVVEGVSDSATPFRLRVMPNRLTAELIAQLKEILLEHPGDHPVLLHLGDDKVLRLPPAYGVDAGSGLVSEIRVLLGPAALVD